MKKLQKGVQKVLFLTDKEEKVMDAIIEKGDYRRAVEFLKTQGLSITEGGARQVTLQIRTRYDNAKRFVELVERYQAALSRKDRKRRYFTG